MALHDLQIPVLEAAVGKDVLILVEDEDVANILGSNESLGELIQCAPIFDR